MFQCVKESIVCVTNGEEKVFENEKAAEEYYATLYGKYEVREISVKKGLLTLSVENITAFIEKYKKENGVEPSFFKKRPWLRE